MRRKLLKRSKALRKGFTLIELLVVIAIIATLVAMILPAIQSAREAARRSQCKNNLKQLALAVHNFHDVERAVPAMSIAKGWATWAVFLLPYVDQGNLYREWTLSRLYFQQPGSAGKNLPIFHCPSQPRTGINLSQGDAYIKPPVMLPAGPPGRGDYAGVGGTTAAKLNDGIFQMAVSPATGAPFNANVEAKIIAGATIPTWRHPISFASLGEKGLSQTLLFGEKFIDNPAIDKSIYNGEEPTSHIRACGVDQQIVNPSGYLNSAISKSQFGSQHAGICHFAFADGRVESLSVSINKYVLHQLSSITNEILNGEF